MRKLSILRPSLVTASLVMFSTATSLTSTMAVASGTIKIDDTKWVSLGAGLRTSYNSFEDDAPSESDRSNDFRLDSVRLYVNGQIHENIKFEFNTERQDDGEGDDDIRVLDALAKFEFSDLVNIWAGRFLPPSDRSNLDGPYYLNTWNFPIAQAFPAIFAGRDDGAALWGQVNGGQFKYQLGVFEGTGDTTGGPNQDDNLEFAGRLVYNFWDPEPGYYNSSTYYGSKEILAIGASYMTQSDALGTDTAPSDFSGWNIDGLMETTVSGGGVVSLEGAYYDYDRDNSVVVGEEDSDGYFVLASYLFPQPMGIGKLQPMARFQNLDVDGVSDTDVWEVGLNYIIDGHNARISFVYGDSETDFSAGGSSDEDVFQIGVQLQI